MDSIRINSRLWKFKEAQEVEKGLNWWAYQPKPFLLKAKHIEGGMGGKWD
jgi:hypothetical protein